MKWIQYGIILAVVLLSTAAAYWGSMRIFMILIGVMVGIGGFLALLRYPNLGFILLLLGGMFVPFTWTWWVQCIHPDRHLDDWFVAPGYVRGQTKIYVCKITRHSSGILYADRVHHRFCDGSDTLVCLCQSGAIGCTNRRVCYLLFPDTCHDYDRQRH